MVGFEGSGPDKVVRVKAQHALHPIVKRELDLPLRQDKMPWKVGDIVGLHNSNWMEDNGSTITAIITEIIERQQETDHANTCD